MSRTDKTRSWQLKALERPEWLAAVHDHSNGVCDLPPRPRGYKDDYGHLARNGCHWWPTNAYWGSSYARCGCATCSDPVGRRATRRKERHRARREARNLIDD